MRSKEHLLGWDRGSYCSSTALEDCMSTAEGGRGAYDIGMHQTAHNTPCYNTHPGTHAHMHTHTYTHARTHAHTHTYPMPMYSLPLIGHTTPQKGGSKTRVQLLGHLRLFSWAIADWSSCLTPLCKDGSYDGKFTGRGTSSPQEKSLRDALSGAIGRCPGLWLLGVPGNSGSHPT